MGFMNQVPAIIRGKIWNSFKIQLKTRIADEFSDDEDNTSHYSGAQS